MSNEKQFWTAQELAEAAGVTVGRIRQILQYEPEKLHGQKHGRDWLITDYEARRFLAGRKDNEQESNDN